MLGLLSKGEYPVQIPDELRQAFNRWYSDQTKHEGKDKEVPPHLAYPALRENLTSLINTPNSGYKTTRIRTSFDPDLEIPRLQQWFQQNQHPSREQMVTYLNELNSLESRQDRKPLDLANIIYWFKNARAAVRRQSRSMEEDGDNDTDTLSTGSPDDMPILPNKNAVYVVSDPLHHWATAKEESECTSPIIQIMPQSPESEDTRDKRPHSENEEPDSEGKENRCENLPKRQRRDSEEDSQSVDLSMKKEDDYDSSSNSAPSTPRPYPAMTLSTTLSQPPPAHQVMTVLPPAINMYMGSNIYPSMEGNILTPHFKDLNSDDHRKKRSRVFIDPLSEIPKLEKWFQEDTHPSSYMIEKYTEELNHSEYRQRFPKLEPKNVQLWFKNHRAKVKRTRLEGGSILHSPSLTSSPLNNNTITNNNNEDLKETAVC